MKMRHERGDRPVDLPCKQRVRAVGGVFGGVLAFVALLAAPAPSLAQGQWVNPDVYELRDEVKKLSKEIAALRADGFGGGAASVDGAPALSGDAYNRLERLDQQVRQLVGAVEELDQRARAASKRRQAKLAELDFRISRLEDGKKGKHRGRIPGTEALSSVEEPSTAPVAGGRLTPLQPQNSGAGAPPTVLGSIRGQQPGDAVVAQPIFDNPRSAAAAPPRTVPSSRGSASGGTLFDSAIASLQAGDWDSAENQFQSFIQESGGDAREPDARYFLGETYRIRGRFHDAVRTYAAGLKSHPRSKRAPDSWMRLGESLAQLNQIDKACEAFKQVNLRFPDAPAKLLQETKKQRKRAGCR